MEQSSGSGGGVPDVRTDRAHTARIYDYFLGGKDNYEVDRQAAENSLRAFPSLGSVARRQRAFMQRSARSIAESGIDQFIDIGTGIPTEPNLHQIVQAINPGARVLYVDNDPIVLAHAAALLVGDPRGHVSYLHADARRPADILDSPERRAAIDLSRPVSVSIIGILHFLPDDDATRLVRGMLDAVAPGSFLTLSQGVHVDTERAETARYQGAVDSYKAAGIEIFTRSREQIQQMWCDGLTTLDPGIVYVHRWRPEDGLGADVAEHDGAVLGLVAEKDGA